MQGVRLDQAEFLVPFRGPRSTFVARKPEAVSRRSRCDSRWFRASDGRDRRSRRGSARPAVAALWRDQRSRFCGATNGRGFVARPTVAALFLLDDRLDLLVVLQRQGHPLGQCPQDYERNETADEHGHFSSRGTSTPAWSSRASRRRPSCGPLREACSISLIHVRSACYELDRRSNWRRCAATPATIQAQIGSVRMAKFISGLPPRRAAERARARPCRLRQPAPGHRRHGRTPPPARR